MKRSLEMYLLAIGICGLTLGYVAWPGTAWGGALSVVLPFMCGLQPTRLRALAISAGYYLGALGPYAIGELLVTQGTDGWERLMTACLVLAFSSSAWALTGGHHPTAFRRFITMLGAWFATLVTPMGGWGLAHPALGWLFIGKGGMGALTLVAAGVLTSLLLTAIRREREQQAPVSVISGRSLAFAICATVILGGTFDQTAAPSHLGPVAAVSANQTKGELHSPDVQRKKALRLEALLGKLALVNQQHDPILLVFTPQRDFGVNQFTDRQAVLQELRAAVTRHRIGLVVNMAAATLGHPVPATSECIAMLPSTLANTVKFRSPTCNVEVIAMDPSATAPGSRADEHGRPAQLEVACQHWPRDDLKPFLAFWHASASATHPARIVVLSIADGTPQMTHASRFMAKHVLSLAWATRSGVVAEL
ncbi:MAG: hypothetical protein U1D29_11400 [Burkholderiales bacterium]|uniref:hypothetical protein n=1 Tax=Hydrogenophaga sp. TaxID=1904254 RepID=UPI00271E99B6|nr:hypothetical protein [Hydrogenophaga sp.]MDO9505519.1 hypothetical protein [Hydrogenophaga sp.]MDZ4145113.1 hypothetical protein [Burkholderiales bacterium]